MSGRLGNAVELKVQTASQSNPSVFRHGTVSGTTIDWEFKFVGAPTIHLTPINGTTASVVSKDIDADGFYITATIETDADYVDWIAIGSGIEVQE